MVLQHTILLGTAATIGFIHTLLGPDHYVPFVVLSRSRKWSVARTMWITFLCGVGHVLGSIVIGLIGIALGTAISHITKLESIRGDIAAWTLIGFGLAYMIWGIVKAIQNKPHTHTHIHADGEVHEHHHAHEEEHSHLHDKKRSLTTWTLFIVFVLGPCEPLIPILMYPAATHSWALAGLTALVFSIITISTMMVIVAVMTWGLKLLPMQKLERYTHALAGAVIMLSGLGIKFLGL